MNAANSQYSHQHRVVLWFPVSVLTAFCLQIRLSMLAHIAFLLQALSLRMMAMPFCGRSMSHILLPRYTQEPPDHVAHCRHPSIRKCKIRGASCTIVLCSATPLLSAEHD